MLSGNKSQTVYMLLLHLTPRSTWNISHQDSFPPSKGCPNPKKPPISSEHRRRRLNGAAQQVRTDQTAGIRGARALKVRAVGSQPLFEWPHNVRLSVISRRFDRSLIVHVVKWPKIDTTHVRRFMFVRTCDAFVRLDWWRFGSSSTKGNLVE